MKKTPIAQQAKFKVGDRIMDSVMACTISGSPYLRVDNWIYPVTTDNGFRTELSEIYLKKAPITAPITAPQKGVHIKLEHGNIVITKLPEGIKVVIG